MNTFAIITFTSAAVAAATIDDVKVALMTLAVFLIPSVGYLIKTAIDTQTEKLLRARRGPRPDDPTNEEPIE